MINRKFRFSFLGIGLACLLLSGCGSMGILQNLGASIFGNAKLSDAQIRGVKSGECNDVDAPVAGYNLKVGCMLEVSEIGTNVKHLVFCEQGEVYNKCKNVVMNEDLTFYGKPVGFANIWIVSRIND